MPTLTVIHKDGARIPLIANTGETVMEAALNADIRGITAECGGAAACATCHIYVEGGPIDRLPAMAEVEDELLEGVAAERRAESRLSCQIPIDDAIDGLVIRIPERQF